MCKDSNDTVAREPYLSTLVGAADGAGEGAGVGAAEGAGVGDQG